MPGKPRGLEKAPVEGERLSAAERAQPRSPGLLERGHVPQRSEEQEGQGRRDRKGAPVHGPVDAVGWGWMG